MEFKIPEQNIESLENKIKRIRKKCLKYGCDFKYERIGEHFEEIPVYDEEGNETGNTYPVKFIDVECEGVAKVNGWSFAASLEYTEKGNVIKAIPGIEIPKRFYACEPWCEHCKTNRDRRYSFVVLNEESGEFKQVGKSCLKDFTGGLSAEHAALVESFFKEISESERVSFGGGFSYRYYSVKEYVVYAAESIRLFGYVKNDRCSGTLSTLERAKVMYHRDHNFPCVMGYKVDEEVYNETKDRGFNPKNPETVALAEKAIEWAVNNDAENNYAHNLKVACSLEWADYSNLGLLTSAVVGYSKAMGILAEKAEREKALAEAAERSHHVGEVGKRVSFVPAEIKCITSWDTMYGTTWVYKLVDESGNEFTWKTSSVNNPIGCDDEKITKVTGTVKEHKEYRGVKQTELTRCRFESVNLRELKRNKGAA